jgi:hypothetical protein
MLNKISTDTKYFILKWLSFWLVSMGCYILVLKPYGITYIDNIHITIPYFLSCGLLGMFLFKLVPLLNTHHKSILQICSLLIASLIFVALPPFIEDVLPLKEEIILMLMKKQFYYPLFKVESSATKMADIIFQQSLIITLVLYLKKVSQNSKEVIKIFTIVFFLLHTPLIFIFSLTGLVFIIPSLLAGVIFSYLILNYNFGILYSFLVHMVFYLIVGLIYRFI